MPKEKVTVENFDLEAFLRKELRRAFKRSPLFNEAKKRAKREYFEKSKHGKDLRRVHFECAKCKRCFHDKGGMIAVDHIEPIEPLDRDLKDHNEYIERLFCDISNLQVLCNYKNKDADSHDGVFSCHKVKTALESKERAMFKKLQKGKK